ncbi:MAG: hypothetical protein KDB84_07515 [Flavobacteriales bacterium]|nr:hypothetical protein [Flavobacteriales bacterium]
MSEQQIDQILFERIEAYLQGTLAAQELRAFEADLATDPSLREEVAVQRDNMLAVELGGFSRTVVEVVREAGTVRVPGSQRVPAFGMGLRIAASLLLLLGVAWWWTSRPDAFERAYAEYHVTDPGSPVPMSATDDAAFHDAMVDFKVGAYEKAIRKWDLQMNARPNNDTLRYYLANAYAETGEHAKALTLFEQVQGDTTSIFRARAEWRCFLSLVALKERSRILSFQADPGSPFAPRIERIQALITE